MSVSVEIQCNKCGKVASHSRDASPANIEEMRNKAASIHKWQVRQGFDQDEDYCQECTTSMNPKAGKKK